MWWSEPEKLVPFFSIFKALLLGEDPVNVNAKLYISKSYAMKIPETSYHLHLVCYSKVFYLLPQLMLLRYH